MENEEHTPHPSNIAVKILSVAGGFLAGLAFLGFLFMTGMFNSAGSLLFFGLVLIAGAIGLSIAYDRFIVYTFAVSAFVIGFFLFGLGLAEFDMDAHIISLFVIILAVCSLIITQNYVLTFLSVLIINGGFVSFLIENDAYDFIHLHLFVLVGILVYVFLKEDKIVASGEKGAKLYHPLRAGLLFSFLIGLVCLGKRYLIPVSSEWVWLSSIAPVLAVVYLISKLFNVLEIESTAQKIIIYACSVLLLLLTSLSPTIPGALLIILLSFRTNCKAGFVIGILAFIYFVIQYYYDLEFSLLVKSILLFSSGVLFILFYLFTTKKWENE